jgi:hypothetical protein
LELIALGTLFIFFYALLGAARAGELIPEYDYTDDYTTKDYRPQVHTRWILKYLLDIAM